MGKEMKRGGSFEGSGRIGGSLERLKARFECWRRKRVKGTPIPTELMEAAKGLVGRYRPGPLAKALRLDYRRLAWTAGAEGWGRELADQGRRERRRTGFENRSQPPTFVRVPMEGSTMCSSAAEGAGCVELETPRGYKARVWYGRAPSSLVIDVMKGMGEGWR